MFRQCRMLIDGADVIEQTFNISIPHSEDVEKAKLVNLSKEELIAEVIKTKVRFLNRIACIFIADEFEVESRFHSQLFLYQQLS